MGRSGTSNSSVMIGVLDWVSTLGIVVVAMVVIISGIISSVVEPGSVVLPDPSNVVETSSKRVDTALVKFEFSHMAY